MDEFERIEAGLSREALTRRSFRKQSNTWANSILSCFIGNRDEDHEQLIPEPTPFSFNQEPIAFTLLASTQAVLSTVTAITTGFSSLFLRQKEETSNAAAVAASTLQTETPLFEIAIDGIPEPILIPVESPKFSGIQSENTLDEVKELTKNMDSLVVDDDYDGTGFWEERSDPSLSESEIYYGIDSYIDTSKDHEIVMQPIAKKSSKKKKFKVHFEPIVEFMNSAVINDRITIKKYLHSHIFDINIRDKIGYSLLHYASAHGHADLVKFLLDSGADINMPEPEGWTALHFAAIADQLKVCKVLLEHGANAECPNDEETTPIELTDDAKIKKLFEEVIKKKEHAKKVQALYDWPGEDEQDLPIRRGEILKVKARDGDWWLLQNESKQVGLVPRIFVQ